MPYQLKTIAVDLTPMRAGGENGGAKIFILELINHLIKDHPSTEFVLLLNGDCSNDFDIQEFQNAKIILISESHNTSGKKLFKVILNLASNLTGNLLIKSIYNIRQFLNRKTAKRLFEKLHVDLLFCPFTAPMFYVNGTPTVCVIYDLLFAEYARFFKSYDLAYRRKAYHDACKKATNLVSISEFTKTSAIAYNNIDPSNIKTISLRLANRFIAQDYNPSILLNYDITSGNYFLYPANFWFHKNHHTLIDAFMLATDNGLPANFKLILTGAPCKRKQFIKEVILNKGLDSKILVTDYLDKESLSALFKNSCALIFPSLYEGFGMPVLEAMALGVPVACSNLASLPEIVGDAAILFNPHDPHEISNAMLSIANDEKMRHKLISFGFLQVSNFFDSKRMASEYWSIFEKSISDFN